MFDLSLQIWGHASLSHSDIEKYGLKPLSIAKDRKLSCDKGAFSYYYSSITILCEFGSLPTSKKDQRKALNELKKILQIK